ncbi:MAG TPA: cupin domain-containing protein [Polyangiaceae bacterium]
MPDTTITKIDSRYSPVGAMGQRYLASGVRMSMRLWQELPPGTPSPETQRDYEILGYVLSGVAELHVEGQHLRLETGNSYVIPRGARHHFSILERFSAVEVTSPSAVVHARDEAPARS